MTTKVEVTEAAQESVRASIEYVRLVLDSPKAARSLKESFNNFFTNVADFPEMYPLMDDDVLRSIGYRRALYGRGGQSYSTRLLPPTPRLRTLPITRNTRI